MDEHLVRDVTYTTHLGVICGHGHFEHHHGKDEHHTVRGPPRKPSPYSAQNETDVEEGERIFQDCEQGASDGRLIRSGI